MITPFDERGDLDIDVSVGLAVWLVAQGAEGLVLTGTTGEGPAITDEEDWELWGSVKDAVSVPVIAGAGTNDTAHSIEQVKRAEKCGADGVLVVTPYYNKPSQAGIYRHFESVAEATSLPVVMYDIPSRTGRKIATSTLIALANNTVNIVAVKDAAGDPGETARVVAETPESFEVYCGDDSLTLAMLAVGAVGTISVCAHWTAPEMSKMFDAVDAGDWDLARLLNAGLLDSYDFESTDDAPNPVPTKAMLRTLGFGVGEPRQPMGPTPEGLEDEARRLYAALESRR